MRSKTVFMSRPGVVCAAGNSSEELWCSVIDASQECIRKIAVPGGKSFYAARVAGLHEPSGGRYDMRIIRLEQRALSQIEDGIKKIKSLYDAERIGVCIGSCDNGSEFSVAAHRDFFSTGNFPADYELEMQGAGYVSSFIQERYGIKGPCLAFNTACASSAGAVVKAAELIRAGIVDAVITGGVDIASDTVLLGFSALESVSPEPVNPFSVNRKGITLGDGAAFFILSKDSIDPSSPAVILSGYGESSDAHHMTSPEPEGTGAAAAMRKALERASLLPQEIGYVNLHGTGTHLNDSMEAKAVTSVFGEYRVACSSTKSVTGHTLGAAGALEASVCYETLVHEAGKHNPVCPQQVWDGAADASMPPLNIIDRTNPSASGGKTLLHCMSNSFAFGGSNVSLIFSLEKCVYD